jgi:hypothetical protein
MSKHSPALASSTAGVERSPRRLLNALGASPAALPPDICAFGDFFAIVLRTRRSTNAAGVTDPDYN